MKLKIFILFLIELFFINGQINEKSNSEKYLKLLSDENDSSSLISEKSDLNILSMKELIKHPNPIFNFEFISNTTNISNPLNEVQEDLKNLFGDLKLRIKGDDGLIVLKFLIK